MDCARTLKSSLAHPKIEANEQTSSVWHSISLCCSQIIIDYIIRGYCCLCRSTRREGGAVSVDAATRFCMTGCVCAHKYFLGFFFEILCVFWLSLNLLIQFDQHPKTLHGCPFNLTMDAASIVWRSSSFIKCDCCPFVWSVYTCVFLCVWAQIQSKFAFRCPMYFWCVCSSLMA